MLCEYCGKEHESDYGSGRFCSSVCARAFATVAKRAEINKKVSQTLKERKVVSWNKGKIHHPQNGWIIAPEKVQVTSLLEVSKRTVAKVVKRMELPCFVCGWQVNNVACDLHHIVEQQNGGSDEHSNLAYLCPNCHRLAHSGIILPETLVSFEDFVGDEWKNYYYLKGSQVREVA